MANKEYNASRAEAFSGSLIDILNKSSLALAENFIGKCLFFLFNQQDNFDNNLTTFQVNK